MSPESLKQEKEKSLIKQPTITSVSSASVDFLHDLWPGSMFSQPSCLKIYLSSKRSRIGLVLGFLELMAENTHTIKELAKYNISNTLN